MEDDKRREALMKLLGIRREDCEKLIESRSNLQRSIIGYECYIIPEKFTKEQLIEFDLFDMDRVDAVLSDHQGNKLFFIYKKGTLAPRNFHGSSAYDLEFEVIEPLEKKHKRGK